MRAKCSFADRGIPKCNLGTREYQPFSTGSAALHPWLLLCGPSGAKTGTGVYALAPTLQLGKEAREKRGKQA
jgi:hypothetical protein